MAWDTSRSSDFARLGVLVAVSACSQGTCGNDCPDGEENGIVGYDIVAALSAEGDVKPGSNTNTKEVYCYTIGGQPTAATLEKKVVLLNGGNEFDSLAPNQGTYGSSLVNARIRVATKCGSDGTPFFQSLAIKGAWFDPNTHKYLSQFEVTPNFSKDTGLITGRGLLCLFNVSNVNAHAYVEYYLARRVCTSPGSPINPATNLSGGLPHDFANACRSATVPEIKCPEETDTFGHQVFCTTCPGDIYTERITSDYFNYCTSTAKDITQSLAANCEVTEGECP